MAIGPPRKKSQHGERGLKLRGSSAKSVTAKPARTAGRRDKDSVAGTCASCGHSCRKRDGAAEWDREGRGSRQGRDNEYAYEYENDNEKENENVNETGKRNGDTNEDSSDEGRPGLVRASRSRNANLVERERRSVVKNLIQEVKTELEQLERDASSAPAPPCSLNFPLSSTDVTERGVSEGEIFRFPAASSLKSLDLARGNCGDVPLRQRLQEAERTIAFLQERWKQIADLELALHSASACQPQDRDNLWQGSSQPLRRPHLPTGDGAWDTRSEDCRAVSGEAGFQEIRPCANGRSKTALASSAQRIQALMQGAGFLAKKRPSLDALDLQTGSAMAPHSPANPWPHSHLYSNPSHPTSGPHLSARAQASPRSNAWPRSWMSLPLPPSSLFAGAPAPPGFSKRTTLANIDSPRTEGRSLRDLAAASLRPAFSGGTFSPVASKTRPLRRLAAALWTPKARPQSLSAPPPPPPLALPSSTVPSSTLPSGPAFPLLSRLTPRGERGVVPGLPLELLAQSPRSYGRSPSRGGHCRNPSGDDVSTELENLRNIIRTAMAGPSKE